MQCRISTHQKWEGNLGCGSCLLVCCCLSLLILLGAVILSGKLAHDGVRSDIAEMLGKDVMENEGSLYKKGLLRSEVMDSWVTVRAWKTIYFLSSSAFSLGTGIIVTICAAFVAAKVKCRSSLLSRKNGGGNLTFYLQCVFILVGWILMLARWIKTTLSCATSLKKGRFIKILGYFLQAAAVVVNPLCPSLAYFLLNPKELRMNNNISISLPPRPLRGLQLLWNILICLPCIVLLVPLCVVILIIGLLGLFCFFYWYISALVFGSQLCQTLWKITSISDSMNGEYSRYKSILKSILSNEEKIDTFWIVNGKSFYRIKRSMGGVDDIQQNCPKLLSIMRTQKLAENQRLQPIDQKGWMETMSSIFSSIADTDIGVVMEDAFEAYKETTDVLKFLDCPENIALDPMSIFGTLNVRDRAASINWEGKICKVEKKLAVSIEERSRVGMFTSEERERVDKMLRDLSGQLKSCDERVSNCLLIRLEQCSYYNMVDLGEMLSALVGRVIVSALLEAQDVMLEYTKQWVRWNTQSSGYGIWMKGKSKQPLNLGSVWLME